MERRAISSAYYALFHELVSAACEELLGPDLATEARRNAAARWFSHTDLRSLAQAVLTADGRLSGNRAVSTVLVPGQDLVRIADAFLTLQEQRERADYDHTYDIDRPSALTFVDMSRKAVDRVRQLRKVADPSMAVFLRLMLGAVKIAKSR